MTELKGSKSVEYKLISIREIKPNPDNPRVIKDKDYHTLKKSIENQPEMMYARPIVVNEENVVLGGNMRLRVLQDLKVSMIPVMKASWNKDQADDFIIKDNGHSGSYDWDKLANEWDIPKYTDWMDIPEQWSYEPDMQPIFESKDVTEEEIQKRAKELAKQMISEKQYKQIMCPSCGHEFDIEAT